MHAPQIIFLVLICLELGAILAKDGEPKKGNYSFGTHVLSASFLIALLYWGGFFTGGV